MSYKPTEWRNKVYDEEGNLLQDGTPLWAEYFNNMEDGIVRAHLQLDSKGKPKGLATLDENGVINVNQLPTNLKEMEVVYSLEEMESIDNKFKGLRVLVIINEEWNEYVYDGEKFIKVGSSENLNIVLDWDNIKDKPEEFKPGAHLHKEEDIQDLDKYTKEEVDNKLKEKSNTGHKHKESDISDLDKYSKEEIDAMLLGKSNTGHCHKELHIHNNKGILDKLVNLGEHDQIDLDLIYTHKHKYNEIQDKPSIPSKTSELANDSNFISGNTGRITVSESAPLNPKENDIWIVI